MNVRGIPVFNAPGANAGIESLLVNGPIFVPANGNGKCNGDPTTTGPSIPADPFTLVTPSPMAGKMPVPHFNCPPTLASSKLNDMFILDFVVVDIFDHRL